MLKTNSLIYRFWALAWIIGFGMPVLAQATGGGHWQQFGLPDGLASLRVTAMAQSSDGYLWFGTDGWGVSRYDGKTLRTYTRNDGLAGNRVDDILEDSAGHLWVLTDRGACRFDGQDFSPVTIRDSNQTNLWEGALLLDTDGQVWIGTDTGVEAFGHTRYRLEHGLPDEKVNALLQDRDGAIWVGTDSGLARKHPVDARFLKEDITRRVTALIQDRKGDIWCATENGVWRYQGVRWQTVPLPERGTVHALLEDSDGMVWVATDRGVHRYNGSSWMTFTTVDGLGSNRVYTLLEDHEGYLWFGTESGVSRYDRAQLLSIAWPEDMKQPAISAIHESEDGALWFGTEKGVRRYDGKAWQSFAPGDGPVPTIVHDIHQADDALWFGTESGVSRYNGRAWRNFTRKDGLGHNTVYDVHSIDNAVWVATHGGVSRYEDGVWTTFTIEDSLAHNVVWSIHEDRQGLIWVATSGGVSYYDGSRWHTLTSNNGLVHDSVWRIVEEQAGTMWFVTREHGVSRYENGLFTTYNRSEGLVGDIMTAVFQDRGGGIWFGARRGVSHYDGMRLSDVVSGFDWANRDIRSIIEDRQGHIWIGTSGSGVIHYHQGFIQRLSRQDGLIGDNIHRLFVDRSGDVWIAASEGLTRYRHRKTSPPVVIQNVTAERRLGPQEQVVIPDSQRYLSFDFNGISFKTRRAQLLYLYRLEGYNDSWLRTSDSQAEYTDLPAGDYVFQVRAMDRDLSLSTKPAQVRVTVLPSYGGYIWGILMITALGGLIAVSRVASRRRRERDDARTRLVEAQQQLVNTLDKELQSAHDVQMGLLPQQPPEHEAYEFAGRCVPASHVGGDHYAYRWLDEERRQLCFLIADVAGKGMKAAMTVMRFSEVLHYEIQATRAPSEMLTSLSRALKGRMEKRHFITAVAAVLEVETGRLTVSCAGHPPMYLYSKADQTVTEVDCAGPPLGIDWPEGYRDADARLSPGDLALFYTDGLYEATDQTDEPFGFERLMKTFKTAASEPNASEVLNRVYSAVRIYTGSLPQEDDMTAVVVKAV